VRCKTKKSFTTKEAALADQILHRVETVNGATDQFKLEWVRRILEVDYTPTFEITTPKYPIVVLYKTDELTLLHIRENLTGRYLTESEIKDLEPPFPIAENQIGLFSLARVTDSGVVNEVSWEMLKKYAEETEGVEGLVIQFKNGDMVKLKTAWYVLLHRTVVFTRWRDIARAVIADTSDDLKGMFALTGRDIAPIVKVEREIKRKIQNVSEAVELHVQTGKILERTPKDMALAFKDHELFGQIMAAFRGKEIDWMSWYDKFHLESTWGLEVVGEEA
jgi:RNA ligase